jgi:hypothetical protein
VAGIAGFERCRVEFERFRVELARGGSVRYWDCAYVYD